MKKLSQELDYLAPYSFSMYIFDYLYRKQEGYCLGEEYTKYEK